VSATDGDRLVSSVARRIRVIGWTAGVIAGALAFAAIGFLIPVFYDAAERDELFWENLPLVAAAILIGGIAIHLLMSRELSASLGWVREGREPNEREHRRTLALAGRLVVIMACVWALGTIVLSAWNIHNSLGFAAVVLSVGWFSGEAYAGILYLLYKRELRPLTALALMARESERSVAPGIRNRLLFAWSLGTGVPILGVLIVGVVGVTKSGVETEYVAGACVFLGCLAVVVGLLATVFSARAIADPVVSVREALDRVAEGDLEAAVPIDDSSEVGQLQAGFNRMAEGLRERSGSATCSAVRSAGRWRGRRCARAPAWAGRSGRSARSSSISRARPRWPWQCRRPRWCGSSTASSASSSRRSSPRAGW
jgi:adenylate cyclase